MATKYQFYSSGDDGYIAALGNTWRAQTFTPSTKHRITSIKLLLYRSGSPGTITVSIRGTSGGVPTGADLCSGTTNGNTLPIGSPYEWREITFTSGYVLQASTKYAIVVRVPDSGADYLAWRVDGTSPTYTGGAFCSSGNAGSSWEENTSIDCMFEEWGDTDVLRTLQPIIISQTMTIEMAVIVLLLRILEASLVTQTISIGSAKIKQQKYQRFICIPTGLSGQAGKGIRVNATEDGFELADLP